MNPPFYPDDRAWPATRMVAVTSTTMLGVVLLLEAVQPHVFPSPTWQSHTAATVLTTIFASFLVAAATRHFGTEWTAAAMRRAALSDSLTGLPNRDMLTDRLRALVARSQREPDALYA